ncbi:MAG: hypothetical protein BAJALOKI3v1_660002 [Promethearchaeota archaeon]|nr:MAG: hypothetical protein BAJALOKI3v1_660002 [Candidatus Lokiarchaeota archaeon]
MTKKEIVSPFIKLIPNCVYIQNNKTNNYRINLKFYRKNLRMKKNLFYLKLYSIDR